MKTSYLSLAAALTITSFSSLSANMSVDWSDEYLLPVEQNVTINSISIVDDGAIYSVGTVNGSEIVPIDGNPPEVPDFNILVMKNEANGSNVWTKSFGSALLPDEATNVIQTADNGIIVVGTTVSSGEASFGFQDIFITKLDANGTMGWTELLGTSGRDLVKDVVSDANGNIYIAGVSDGNLSDINSSLISDYSDNPNYSNFILKVDSQGQLVDSRMFADNFDYCPESTDKTISIKINENLDVPKIYTITDGRANTDSSMVISALDLNISQNSFGILYQNQFNGSLANRVQDFDFSTESNGTVSLFVATSLDVQKLSLSEYNVSELGETEIYDNVTALKYDNITDSIYLSGNHDSEYAVIFKVNAQSMERLVEKVLNHNDNYGNTVSAMAISETGITIAGSLTNESLSDGNISGNTLFLANLTDNYSIIDLTTGWNLVSGNIQKESLSQEVTAVYKYSETDLNDCLLTADDYSCKKEWSVFSPDAKLNNDLHLLANIKDIDSMSNSNGLWVLAENNVSINVGYNDTNISTSNYPNGWSLNGIGIETNVSQELLCKNSLNHNNKTWKLNNGEWNINAQDNSFLPTIGRFDMLQPNDGFWVNCEFQPFLGFSDAGLTSCVNMQLSHLEDNASYIPTEEELLSIHSLDYCSAVGIQNIDGIDRMQNLSSLSLADNNIYDISVLYNLPNLMLFDLNNNPDINHIQIDDLNNYVNSN